MVQGFPGGPAIKNPPCTLVWEGPACCGATRSRTTTAEPLLPNKRAAPALPTTEKLGQ